MLSRPARIVVAATGVVLAGMAFRGTADAQTPQVYVRHAGPGRPGQLLREILARPYTLRQARWNARLFRDSVFQHTVVVLGSDAAVASTVHGDIVVIDGDLFLQPGAVIDGRAMAIGGGVYASAQARVRGASLAFRDTRFAVVPTNAGIALDYQPPPREAVPVFALRGLWGFRTPLYDRVDGLSLTWGPRVAVAQGALTLDPALSYRSNLGAFDAGVRAAVHIGRQWSVVARGRRTTLSNDDWIQSDLANSISVLVSGHDYRNYWRADRIGARVERGWTSTSGDGAIWAGARTERDWSVAAGGPWSLFGRQVGDGIARPNPAVAHGRLTSGLVGGSGEWSNAQVNGAVEAEVEVPFRTPGGGHFVQGTIGGDVHLATFRSQQLVVRAHAVLTAGDTAPPQRFAYLGGSGTLPTFAILGLGGDELIFAEGRYEIPIDALHVPFLGAPVVALREMVGTAGVHSLPALHQNVGVRLSFSLLRLDYAVDPATGRHAVLAGVSLIR